MSIWLNLKLISKGVSLKVLRSTFELHSIMALSRCFMLIPKENPTHSPLHHEIVCSIKPIKTLLDPSLNLKKFYQA